MHKGRDFTISDNRIQSFAATTGTGIDRFNLIRMIHRNGDGKTMNNTQLNRFIDLWWKIRAPTRSSRCVHLVNADESIEFDN